MTYKASSYFKSIGHSLVEPFIWACRWWSIKNGGGGNLWVFAGIGDSIVCSDVHSSFCLQAIHSCVQVVLNTHN